MAAVAASKSCPKMDDTPTMTTIFGPKRRQPPRAGTVVSNSLLLLALFVFPAAFCFNLQHDQHGAVYLLKKSEQPQWEDLGWAWGKRSAPNSEPSSPPASAVANWEDLGWAWGKRSVGGIGGIAALRRARASGAVDPIVSLSANRVLRSMAKQSPDWHDLGWAWGRRK